MTNPALHQQLSWQEILASTVSSSEELCRLLELDMEALPAGHPLLAGFPVRVPLPYLARIEKGNPADPLLLQVFPSRLEASEVAGYADLPLQEAQANPASGILHKYNGRALLLLTSSCAIHCRYCFRRHFPYADTIPGRQEWVESLDYLKNDSSIREVIFSGGDPLTLPDRSLAWFLEALSDIDHIQTVRIHTRLPIMIPQRITRTLCELLAKPGLRTMLVIHANHARELDMEVDQACQALRNAGITLLNQSVLLRGINDSVQALEALSERLFSAGVLPYYLHMLDRVNGAAHFEVDDDSALALMKALQQRLPGYLVPRLVREIPGEQSKIPVMDVT